MIAREWSQSELLNELSAQLLFTQLWGFVGRWLLSQPVKICAA